MVATGPSEERDNIDRSEKVAMFSYPIQPTHGDHVSGTSQDDGLIPQDIRDEDVRPCGLNHCFSSTGCYWSLASDTSGTDSPNVHFLHRIEGHRGQSATRLDCHPCPLLCCHHVCNHSERVLEYVSACGFRWNGDYWCPKHRAAERSTAVGKARLLKCLHYPARLCKRVHTKVHEKALLAGTKRVLQKLGSTRQRKSTLFSSSSRSSSTMPDELCEDGSIEFGLTPELDDTQFFSELPPADYSWVFELPPAKSSRAEFPAEWYKVEKMTDEPLATIPYGPSSSISSLSGIDHSLSIAPSSEAPTISLDSPMAESDAFGNIFISLRLPEHHPGQHEYPNVDHPSTGVDPQQGYSDLVSPMSPDSQLPPVSQVSLPSSQANLRSSTINTSGVPNLRRLSDHYSCRVVSPLTGDENACSTCGSTGHPQHNSAIPPQPANEYIADGRGSYSVDSAVPLPTHAIPKRRPVPQKQSEGDIAEKKSHSTVDTDLPPRLSAENAHPRGGLLHNWLLLRGEAWRNLYLNSQSPSNTDALMLDDMASDDQLMTTPERYERNPISFDDSLSTAHHIQSVDKTTLSTTPAQWLVTDTSIATSVTTGKERCSSASKLPSLFDVMVDVPSGAEAHQSHMTKPFHKAFGDVTENVVLTESGALQNPQDPYVDDCMDSLRYPSYLLQGSPECREDDNDWVAEDTGRECRKVGGAQRLVQRLDCFPKIGWEKSSPDYINPMDTLSPSPSFQTDSGYGTTSPTASTGLRSLPATPLTQGSDRGTKRSLFDITSPSSYHSQPDCQSTNPRVTASTAPRNSRQHDRDSSGYLKCTVRGCGATFGGISKHRPSNLRKHMRTTHDPVTLKCRDSSCTSTFNRRDNLRAHCRTFHKDRTDAELGLPSVTQKRKKPGRVKKIAGDMREGAIDGSRYYSCNEFPGRAL